MKITNASLSLGIERTKWSISHCLSVTAELLLVENEAALRVLSVSRRVQFAQQDETRLSIPSTTSRSIDVRDVRS